MAARKQPPKSFSDRIKAGHREALEAMRDKLAADMELAEPAVVAQIAGRLQAVLKELAELGDSEEVSPLDALTARRAVWLAGSQPGASAG